MSAPISRPRVRAGCTGGDMRSHPGRSGVRAAAMMKKVKKALRGKRKQRRKANGESERIFERENLYS